MYPITVNDIKKIQVEILSDVHDFCVKHEITYCLAYGTLIGCIRHKGFIPWDDDIDIVMPRPDYNIFIKHYKSPRYNLHCLEYDKTYPYLFAKISDKRTRWDEHVRYKVQQLGVYIDVFPVEALPAGRINCFLWGKLMLLLYRILEVKNLEIDKRWHLFKQLFLQIMHLLLSLFPYKAVLKFMNFLANTIKWESATKVTIYDELIDGKMNSYNRESFERTTTKEFERFRFCVPIDYDKLLRCYYGEYMSLPPIEKQISHHKYIAYWKADTSNQVSE